MSIEYKSHMITIRRDEEHNGPGQPEFAAFHRASVIGVRSLPVMTTEGTACSILLEGGAQITVGMDAHDFMVFFLSAR